MIGTLEGVEGLNPVQKVAAPYSPASGNISAARLVSASQRTAFRSVEYPESSAVPAMRMRLPRRVMTIFALSSGRLPLRGFDSSRIGHDAQNPLAGYTGRFKPVGRVGRGGGLPKSYKHAPAFSTCVVPP